MSEIKAITTTAGTTYEVVDRFSQWGGNNLLKNVKKSDTPASYCAAQYNICDNLVAGQVYTVQMWFTNSGRKSVSPYIGGGSYATSGWLPVTDSSTYMCHTFTATTQQANAAQFINFYASNNANANQGSTTISGTFTVHKAKLERGHKATDWSPCYADLFTYGSETINVNI